MEMILHILSSVFWGICVLSFLVFIHEAGHFIAARCMGMRVVEFFLGMPSSLRLSFRLKHWGTELGITPIVLGGYTKICGMEGSISPQLKDCLLFAYARGEVSAQEVADHFGVSAEEADLLLRTLVDWASLVRIEREIPLLPARPGETCAGDAEEADASAGALCADTYDASQAVDVRTYYQTAARDPHYFTVYDLSLIHISEPTRPY